MGDVDAALAKHNYLYKGDTKPETWDSMIQAMGDRNPWEPSWYSRFEDDQPAIGARVQGESLDVILHGGLPPIGRVKIRDRQKIGTLEWETVVCLEMRDGTDTTPARLRQAIRGAVTL